MVSGKGDGVRGAVEVAAAGCLEVVPDISWDVVGGFLGAENSWEVEAWEFGRAGRAEVTGDGGFGGISSARTNTGESYPQLLRIHVGMNECRELARVPGTKSGSSVELKRWVKLQRQEVEESESIWRVEGGNLGVVEVGAVEEKGAMDDDTDGEDDGWW